MITAFPACTGLASPTRSIKSLATLALIVNTEVPSDSQTDPGGFHSVVGKRMVCGQRGVVVSDGSAP